MQNAGSGETFCGDSEGENKLFNPLEEEFVDVFMCHVPSAHYEEHVFTNSSNYF